MADQSTQAIVDAIVDAIEANTTDAFVRWGRLLDATFAEEQGVTRFVTGLPFEFGNAVVRARLDAATADERIRAIRDDYAERSLPMAWLVSPSSQPADLAARLEAQGMIRDDEAPGMALDLREAALEAALPAGVTIAEVADGATLGRWIETMVAGSGLPDPVRGLLSGLLASKGFRRAPDVRFFLASEGERPVATALLFLSGTTAGIYDVATLPDTRGRGVGSAITLMALRAAREARCTLGVLQSSAMGYNLYRRLGFREHCRFRLYFG